MTLRLHNTLTRKVEPFQPLQPGRVSLYTCGPTVYNYAHIGNFRTFLFEDLLRRWLEASGYAVFHIMNLTDVDDRTIAAAREKGVGVAEGRYQNRLPSGQCVWNPELDVERPIVQVELADRVGHGRFCRRGRMCGAARRRDDGRRGDTAQEAEHGARIGPW